MPSCQRDFALLKLVGHYNTHPAGLCRLVGELFFHNSVGKFKRIYLWELLS